MVDAVRRRYRRMAYQRRCRAARRGSAGAAVGARQNAACWIGRFTATTVVADAYAAARKLWLPKPMESSSLDRSLRWRKPSGEPECQWLLPHGIDEPQHADQLRRRANRRLLGASCCC